MNTLTVIAVVSAVASSLLWLPAGKNYQIQDVEQRTLLNAVQGTVETEDIKTVRVSKWNVSKEAADMVEVSLRPRVQSEEDSAAEEESAAEEWQIISHHNYPADGGDRVGKTAGKVMNVQRGPLVSSDVLKHAELGVLDPVKTGDEEVQESGYGNRVTILGAGSKVLVDLIVGNAADGDVDPFDRRNAGKPRMHYVREAGSDDVFTADIDFSISSAFKDWVETDLLKIDESDIRQMVIQDYSVDESTMQLQKRAETVFQRENDKTDWSSRQLPTGKELSAETVKNMMTEIAGLRLNDIRPYDAMWMQARGFFITQDQHIYGNEGAVSIHNQDGSIYQLYFGEIALDATLDVSAEVAASAKKTVGDERYMSVFVRYDESQDQTLRDILAAQKVEAEKKIVTAEGDAEAADKENTQKESIEPEVTRDFPKELHDRRTAMRTSLAAKQKRFAQFFYVIADSSFKKLRPSQDALFIEPKVEPKKEEAKANASPVAAPFVPPAFPAPKAP